MSAALQGHWTTNRFLDWAGSQEGRYEFDGIQPQAMTGGTARHNQIAQNIYAALRSRLRGGPCAFFGPDLGVQIGNVVRYPDALITCMPFPDSARLAPNVSVVFEVISPSSGRIDRITKVREYARVDSIRRYIMVESRFPGLLVLHRAAAGDGWTAQALLVTDELTVPEAGIVVPVAELYDEVNFGVGAGDE